MTSKAQTAPRVDLSRIYTQELLLRVFGTLEPTLEQRTSWTFHAWRDRRYWCMNFANSNTTSTQVRSCLLELGLQEFADFLIHGQQVRFHNAELKALATLAASGLLEDRKSDA